MKKTKKGEKVRQERKKDINEKEREKIEKKLPSAASRNLFFII